MCLIALAWKANPRWPLVVAANRDEFRNRRTAALSHWPDNGIIGGRDLKQGGTWLGMTEQGRFAAITNRRAAQGVPATAPSRGELVAGFLRGVASAAGYAEQLRPRLNAYAGFNLLVADRSALWYLGNAPDAAPRELAAGVWALSNGSLDSRWPKMQRVEARLRGLLDTADETGLQTALFDMLKDNAPAADHELPDTGVGRQFERLLSAPFVNTPAYGTRSSALILVNHNGEGHFVERRFNRLGYRNGETRLSFQW